MRKHVNNDSGKPLEVPVTANIMVTLKGEEAERFLAYKAKQFLTANTEAGRKLMLERLTQVEGEAA